MEPDTIFIWNDESFAFLLEERFRVIKSGSELKAAALSQAKRIFILAELEWGGRKLSDFYGFAVLKELRFERRLRCPINIASFLQVDFFSSFQERVCDQRQLRLFNALYLPGQALLPLPFEFCDLESYTSERLTRDELEQIIDSFFDLDEVRDLVGSDSHPGTLLQNLEGLIRGIKGFNEGRTGSISGIPYNNELALKNIKRHLCLTVSVLDRYCLLDRLTENDRETLRACLDPTSSVGRDFHFFVNHARDIDQRITAFAENDSAGVLERLTKIAEALPRARKCF